MDNTFGLLFLSLILTGLSDCSCPDGWMRHGQMCYHFSHDLEYWTAAKDMCEIIKGQLVEIETAEENHFIGQQAKTYNSYYWIALTDIIEEDTWVWMNSLKPATFATWLPGEPAGAVNENCVVMYPGGNWSDAPCLQKHYYICEKADGDEEIIGKR